MSRVTARHILVTAAALALGALLDHVLGGQWFGSASKHSDASIAGSVVFATPMAKLMPAAVSAAALSPAVSATPKKSLDAILADRDPRLRASELEAFIKGLSPSEYADALKRIHRIPGNSERELASRLLVAQWVQTDPAGALNFASTNRGFEYIAEDVFEAEATVDLQSALNRATALADPNLRYMALRGVLSFMADSDPVGALALAPTLGNFPGNQSLSSMIYQQWATYDPQAAALQAMQDPSGDSSYRSAISQVARAWAAQDPMAAANWSLSLTDPGTAARSLSQVMREWATTDVTAAANWVNALPAGSAHDAASAALAYSVAPTDPQSAVSWADSIADDTARTNALQRVSREVMWRDPTNGAALLQAAGVPGNLIPPPGQRGPR